MNPLLRDLLADVEPRDLLEFHGLACTLAVPRGAALYTPGQIPRGLTFVVQGRVRVDREGELIAELGAGSYFGERTLVAEEPIGVHLLALEDVACLEFPTQAARQFVHDHPAFGVAILKALFTGNLARLSATSRAFLEKRALAAQLEARNAELQESLEKLAEVQGELVRAQHLASLGTMVAGVAHEINNPLAYVIQSISTALERAKEAPPEVHERIAKPLARALEGADRIRTIVSDLRGGADPASQADPVADTAREAELALKMVERQALDAGVRLTLAGDAGRAAIAPVQLGQVLVNLLKNAVDASPRGATVELTAARHASHAVLAVRDDGAGMPPEVRARIFDPFFTTKPVGKGTGLGLWVCQNIVARAGGALTCETAPGAGTTFTVRIPKGTEE